jgi:hypothetical protein
MLQPLSSWARILSCRWVPSQNLRVHNIHPEVTFSVVESGCRIKFPSIVHEVKTYSVEDCLCRDTICMLRFEHAGGGEICFNFLGHAFLRVLMPFALLAYFAAVRTSPETPIICFAGPSLSSPHGLSDLACSWLPRLLSCAFSPFYLFSLYSCSQLPQLP